MNESSFQSADSYLDAAATSSQVHPHGDSRVPIRRFDRICLPPSLCVIPCRRWPLLLSSAKTSCRGIGVGHFCGRMWASTPTFRNMSAGLRAPLKTNETMFLPKCPSGPAMDVPTTTYPKFKIKHPNRNIWIYHTSVLCSFICISVHIHNELKNQE